MRIHCDMTTTFKLINISISFLLQTCRSPIAMSAMQEGATQGPNSRKWGLLGAILEAGYYKRQIS